MNKQPTVIEKDSKLKNLISELAELRNSLTSEQWDKHWSEYVYQIAQKYAKEERKEIYRRVDSLMNKKRAKQMGDNFEQFMGKRECHVCGTNFEKQREMILKELKPNEKREGNNS